MSAGLVRPGVCVPARAAADTAPAAASRHDVTMNRRLGVISANQVGWGKVSTLRVRMVSSCCLLRGHGLILSRRRAARSSHQPNMKTEATMRSQDARYIWSQPTALFWSRLRVTDHKSRIGLDKKIAKLLHR